MPSSSHGQRQQVIWVIPVSFLVPAQNKGSLFRVLEIIWGWGYRICLLRQRTGQGSKVEPNESKMMMGPLSCSGQQL